MINTMCNTTGNISAIHCVCSSLMLLKNHNMLLYGLTLWRERERDRENDQADMTDGDLTGPTPIRPFSLGCSVPVGYQLDTSLIPV